MKISTNETLAFENADKSWQIGQNFCSLLEPLAATKMFTAMSLGTF